MAEPSRTPKKRKSGASRASAPSAKRQTPRAPRSRERLLSQIFTSLGRGLGAAASPGEVARVVLEAADALFACDSFSTRAV
jgi:hypothetical protein